MSRSRREITARAVDDHSSNHLSGKRCVAALRVARVASAAGWSSTDLGAPDTLASRPPEASACRGTDSAALRELDRPALRASGDRVR